VSPIFIAIIGLFNVENSPITKVIDEIQHERKALKS
jgi:hypothetical protein